MAITLHLPAELEERLTQEAARQGLALDTYARQLIESVRVDADHQPEPETRLSARIVQAEQQVRRALEMHEIREAEAGLELPLSDDAVDAIGALIDLLESCHRRQQATDLLQSGPRQGEGAADPLVKLLQSWIEEGDAEEQRATGEFLIHALDEHRLSDRRLFPPELQGVTW